ncbi:MAG TPA: hypothetical protein VKP88_00540, partial [Candidatus Paceibacterota bacterium]|nr:hypothetical protein [Candidatus Paceibacterota bacterium]
NIQLASTDATPEVVEEEICWSVGAVDSSLTRFLYIDPADSTNNQVLFYVNASGSSVNVSGGTLSLGFCGCCEGPASAVSNASLFVYRLSQGEDYSLPLDTLAKYDQLFIYASGDDSVNDTATVNLPTFQDNGSDAYIGKQLFFHLQELTADSSSVVVITAPGDPGGSRLRQYNCYNSAVTSQNDTFSLTTEGIERLIKYTTVPRKTTGDYFRECLSKNVFFDGDRAILRVPTAGTNIGSTTVTEWLNWWYFTPPTISLAQSPSTSTIEVGDTQQYTYTATTTNTGAATLAGGSLFVVSGDELDDYGASTTGTATIDFTPLQTPADTFDSPSYQIRASQSWISGAESGTATSNTRTIQAVYP